jgi:phage gp29-like protein
LVTCGVAAFPEGTTLEIKTDQSKGAATGNFSEFERYFNENISKVILGGTLTTDIGAQGSYSAAQVHNDVRNDIALSDRETLAEAHNDVLNKITKFNLGDDAVSPRF